MRATARAWPAVGPPCRASLTQSLALLGLLLLLKLLDLAALTLDLLLLVLNLPLLLLR